MLSLSPAEEVENVSCSAVLAEEVEQILSDYVPDMKTILTDTEGLGLAAPQVGIKKRFFVSRSFEKDGFNVYFNPFYTKNAERINVREGCLTYGKDNFAEVKRFKAIRFVYDEYDTATKTFTRKKRLVKGMEACVLQHENNHLGNGQGVRGTTIFM